MAAGSAFENVVFRSSLLEGVSADERAEAVHMYFQQLWQMDNVLVLLGSGFSRHMDGPLMADLAEKILPQAICESTASFEDLAHGAEEWLTFWGLEPSEQMLNLCREGAISEISKHCRKLNIENKIGEIQSVLSASSALGISAQPYEKALVGIKTAVVKRIEEIFPPAEDPATGEPIAKLEPYRAFLRRLISYRRPRQPRVKLFTTNYDTVVELACDLEHIHCVSGFDGSVLSQLNPTLFDLELSYRATGHSSVYYSDVVHLYKLHGSVDWRVQSVDNMPEVIRDANSHDGEVVIYPCYTKYSQSLEMPYGEMFRRFSESIALPQTVLLTLGYGFGDSHVNQMISRALQNPSCQLVVCAPDIKAGDAEGKPEFLRRLLRISESQEAEHPISDPRIAILSGDGALFPTVLKVLFPALTIDNPTDRIRRLVAQLLALGEAKE